AVDRGEVAVAAADLHGDGAGGRDDPADEAGRRRAGEGPVEVDEMQEARALRDEARGRGRGIAALNRDPLALPLGQPHASSLEYVERGQDEERAAFACSHATMLT